LNEGFDTAARKHERLLILELAPACLVKPKSPQRTAVAAEDDAKGFGSEDAIETKLGKPGQRS
jgi:hypothetical protein